MKGMKSGYARKKSVPAGTPRTPKPSTGGTGPSATRAGVRAQDGTRQNSQGKK